MTTVSGTLKMFDAMSGPLKNITSSMNLMISAMYKMQSAANQNVKIDKTLIVAKQQIAAAEASIRQHLDQASKAQQQFNRSVHESNSGTSGLLSNIKEVAAGIAAAYLSAEALQAALKASDTFISTQARLNLIVDKGQTLDDLQANVFAAAQRARGDFVSMASSISKLGLLAGDAFNNNDEIVRFAELMQKSFKVSGSSSEEQIAGMYQLTQAMAAGKLQGDEFRSIMENAPMLADAIAKFTHKTKGELKDMSADGTITADIIKGALFAAADDINKKFETMPKTFGDVFQQFKNEAFMAFEPVFQKLSGWLNSTQGSAFLQSMINALHAAAYAANQILDAIIWIVNAVQSGWSIIEPILVAIGSAYLALIIQRLWAMIPALWAAVPPLLAQAAAWLAINWPILLIGAAIGLIIYSLYRWGDATAEVVGFVGGIFGVLFAFLSNSFALFANVVLSVAEFFINVWKDPVYATKKLFYDLVINALKWMENLAKGIENIINKIPGLKVNITEGLGNILKNLEEARDSLKTEADVVKLMRFEQKDYGEAFSAGQKMGRAVGKFAADGVQSAFNSIGGLFNAPTLDSALNVPKLGSIDKVGEVGKIKDKVDISSEDLKVMRELAEMKNIQNFVTLQPQLTFGDTHVRQDGRSIEEIIANISDRLHEEIASSARGILNV
ncbi:tape measure protein [Brevibacillus massiliensis]|uniref:tape measure protein n=1 Tax=Brevibacillus massiliensis TaxID=1118054 RepID=UPI0002EF3956|nr:tape measure protein [Brevibacillus massiliensis]